jgi:DNA (cytosine-5)-methyltransferase 1
MKTSFTAVDLFAGIGGFRIAIERCGGHCTAFSEINNDAIDAYTRNYSDSGGTNLGDITALKQLPHHDLLTGGVPCQSWSIAGRNLGFDDDRGQLWNDALFLLNQSRPRAFIFENVKGLADPRNKEALDHILKRIKDAGYFATYHVLNSFDYGVPQSRTRIYIIGFCEQRFLKAFRLPEKTDCRVRLMDIMDGEIIEAPMPRGGSGTMGLFGDAYSPSTGSTSLSSNNNGFNDYFLFNDIRNGSTTIHSWDMLNTDQRQKHICLLLLRNRRKKDFGPLDGNPLSLAHFQSLDKTIAEADLDKLVSLGILKTEKYAFSVAQDAAGADGLSDCESLVLARQEDNLIIPDKLVCDRKLKIGRVNIAQTLDALESKGLVQCSETRFEFRHTKISTGLFGICRIFLPSSDIFPTLVASDSNDYLTPVSIAARNNKDYKTDFMEHVFAKKLYRKISKAEACRIQGFPENFHLPDSRSRWMKLLGNSVSVPVIEKLVRAVAETGVFDKRSEINDYTLATMQQPSRIMLINKMPMERDYAPAPETKCEPFFQ